MTLGERCIVKAHQYSEGIVQLNEDGGSQCETWLVRPENWLVYLEAHEETEGANSIFIYYTQESTTE